MIKKTLLKDTVEFEGTIYELHEKIKLNSPHEFKLEWVNQSNFKFLSDASIGALMFNKLPGLIDGIKGYGKLVEVENGNIRIEINTEIRIELYIFLFILGFIYFIGYMVKVDFPIWTYSIPPISLLVYWFILRIQEESLFEQFKKYINRIK